DCRMTSLSISRTQCRPAIWPCALALALITSGCALVSTAEPTRAQAAPPQPDRPPQAFQAAPPLVTRTGRYTLIELGPDDAQRALMDQLVQTSIPASVDATVGDGLHFLLARTGYRICDEGHDAGATDLFALPLPA